MIVYSKEKKKIMREIAKGTRKLHGNEWTNISVEEIYIYNIAMFLFLPSWSIPIHIHLLLWVKLARALTLYWCDSFLGWCARREYPSSKRSESVYIIGKKRGFSPVPYIMVREYDFPYSCVYIYECDWSRASPYVVYTQFHGYSKASRF